MAYKQKVITVLDMIIQILIKSIIASLIFYSLYYFQYSTTTYVSQLVMLIDVYFFTIIANIVSVFISVGIFFMIGYAMDYKGFIGRYFKFEPFFLLLVESFMTAFVFTTTIIPISPEDFGEFVIYFFVVRVSIGLISFLITKLSTTAIKRRSVHKNSTKNVIAAILIMLAMLYIVKLILQ